MRPEPDSLILPHLFLRGAMTVRHCFVLAVASLIFLSATGFAHADKIVFKRDFAPTEALVPEVEKPRRDALCLNGTWQFQPQDFPASYDKKSGHPGDLQLPSPDRWESVPIKIPSPWNVNSFVAPEAWKEKGLEKGPDFRCYPSYPASWENVEMGWLRRTFRIPDAWAGSRSILRFNAVAGRAQVYVNGKLVGEHFDNFLPFEFDITDLVKSGAENELLVAIQKPSLFNTGGKNGFDGKIGCYPYPTGSFWGCSVVGIWDDVYLKSIPTVRVADVFVKPLVDKDELQAEVTLKNDTDAPATVTLKGLVQAWRNLAGSDVLSAPEPKWTLAKETSLSYAPIEATIPAHSTSTVALSKSVKGALNLWSPENPNLYGLVLTLEGAKGQIQDCKYTRFGWRQFGFKGKQATLNGNPIVFKGDACHFMGIPEMTRRHAWAWYKMLKDANGNTLRLHAQPRPSFYLDLADEMGIMILNETAFTASGAGFKLDSPDFWRRQDDHLKTFILRDRNHPSIMGWSVCNEFAAFVEGVLHSPAQFMEEIKNHYTDWVSICRTNDPTRVWISADGDRDGFGQLPTSMLHYQGKPGMDACVKGSLPWGIGENGSAYFATPEQCAQFNGERGYESMAARSEAMAIEAYGLLKTQSQTDSAYRSIFNIGWYSLQPLALGMPDTTHAPTLDDGIFFGPYAEGKPGVQPERIGPYEGTLNPGYDPHLPLYKPWALFEGIRDGFSDSSEPSKWAKSTVPTPAVQGTPVKLLKGIQVIGGTNGKLAKQLAWQGVAFDSTRDLELLFVDGVFPPDASARSQIDACLQKGGTVLVWGASPKTLPTLNALLPAPLELTPRQASSLLPVGNDPVTAGMKPSDLYFSQLDPWLILDGGLAGPLVAKGTVLLKATDTDWRGWFIQPEGRKNAGAVRSERETQPSGAALVSVPVGSGRLLICNIPCSSSLPKRGALVSKLLANLGVEAQVKRGKTETFNENSELNQALVLGAIPVASFEEGLSVSFVKPDEGKLIRDNLLTDKGLRWVTSSANSAASFDFRQLKISGPKEKAVGYLSFWVFSPRALDDLYVEPNVPKVDLIVNTNNGSQVWLNGKSILEKQNHNDGKVEAKSSGLFLQRGWNHMLVKVIQDSGPWVFKASLQCDQPDFLNKLRSALTKPAAD